MRASADIETWLTFAALVVIAMLIDRVIFGSHALGFRSALGRSILWLVVGFGFTGYVAYELGNQLAIDYLTAYLVEKSLSVDNLFVFLVIFRYFGLSEAHQHRVLSWGIAGAVLMRGLFIVLGAAALNHFSWAMYVFGAFLVLTGLRLAFHKAEDMNPADSIVLRFARKHLRVSDGLVGDKFVVRQAGRWLVTPLFLVLLVVEFTDVVFAVDSVPAVLAISNDLFVVYSSNVLAILGLRALYFVLADVMDRFTFLSLGLSVILVLIGVKMLVADLYHVSSLASLAAVGGVICAAIGASLLLPRPGASDDPKS